MKRRSGATVLGAMGLVLAGCEHRLPVGDDGSCVAPYVDPAQLLSLGPEGRSHWLQPWRSYVDTWPASRLRRAIGLNWLSGDPLDDSDAAVRAAAAAGVRFGIVQTDWRAQSFDDPTVLRADAAAFLRDRARLLHGAGIRPVVTVGLGPPRRATTVLLARAAVAGDVTVQLDLPRSDPITVRRTALDLVALQPDAAPLFITSVAADGSARLSRPLPVALAAGAVTATTYKFVAFARPRHADGSPNADFEESTNGLVLALSAIARTIVAETGAGNFDLVLGTEEALEDVDLARSYDAPIDDGTGTPEQSIVPALLARAAAWLAANVDRLGAIRVIDGFASHLWTRTAALEPAGIAAVGRNLSVSVLGIPSLEPTEQSPAVDAVGAPNGARADDGSWRERFSPATRILLPELALTANASPAFRARGSQFVRDLAPLETTRADGVAQGRATGPELWLTSFTLNAAPAPEDGIDAAWRLKQRATLRAVAAYVGKGASAIAFYSPSYASNARLVDWKAPAGGPVLQALGRFAGRFAGPDDVGPARSLTPVSVCGPGKQFDGAATHDVGAPPLTNAEVTAVLPFQVDERRFVVAAYVMTQDVLQPQPGRSGPTRYDLPEATYSITIAGVDAARVEVTGYDPLDDRAVPVKVRGRSANAVTVEMPLTDSPRLLELRD